MKHSIAALVLASALVAAGSAQGAAGPGPRESVMAPSSHPLGLSHEQWSAKWWQWLLSQPLEGHPGTVTEQFNVASGQSGPVWYLAAPLETNVRTCTIPWGKALFVMAIGSEWSDLEGFTTEQEQRDFAAFYADHTHDVFCTVDGVPVDMSNYRFASPQFSFTAPSPWLFGTEGGQGNAVADGFYAFVRPLSVGSHVIRFGGTVTIPEWEYESSIDMTYNLTVTP
jgi:hypothetical protein